MKIKVSAGLNLTLYSLLLIVTPFLMLMNYLQNAIGSISRSHFLLFDVKFPYIFLFAILFLLFLLVYNIKKLTRTRLLGLVIVLILFFIGQKTSDYYFGHHFYDLQHNWHYLAYGLFAYLAYRKFYEKKFPASKIILRTFIWAFCISLFDEIIQVYISNRIFDMSDVGKDMWGVLIGQCFIHFVLFEAKYIRPFVIRHHKLKNYLKTPFTVLFHEAVITYIFLFTASILTMPYFWPKVVLVTILVFAVFFFLIHIGNNHVVKWLLRGVAAIIVFFLVFVSFSGNSNVKYISDNLIVYKGIPIVYFDCMVFPDGSFRLVDKKELFISRDKQKIDNINPDILLIATGSKDQGGKGYNDQRIFEFKPNFFKNNVYQVIKLKTKDACIKYNSLIKENKKVLLIIHNE